MWSTGSNSGLPCTRDGMTGGSPTKGCEGDEGAGAALVRGEVKRSGTVQPKEEKAQGKLSKTVYKYLEGRYKEHSLLGLETGFQWCPVTRPEATDSKWNTGSLLWTPGINISAVGLHCCRCPERLWVSTLGDTQKPSGNSSVWLALGGSANDPNDFMILEFCISNDSRCWSCLFCPTRVRN